MSGSMNFTGSLLAAQAVSFNKGNDVSRDMSKDKLEQARELRKMLVQAKEVDKTKKTNDAQKGILA